MHRYLPHVGLFLVLATVYALSGSGRIDTIDGQYRYEVARHLLVAGSPSLEDPGLPGRMIGRDGQNYEPGPGRAIPSLPLVGIGLLFEHGTDHELSHFLFSFTSALLGALAGVLLFMLYELLGVARRRAIGWTLAVAFGTLMWPIASSAFDQAQHACILLFAVYAGILAGRRDSAWWAALAGLAAADLIACQEALIVLAPALALACLRDGETIKQLIRTRRFIAFCGVIVAVVAVLLIYKLWWIGSAIESQKQSGGTAVFGNPLLGVAGLLVSPGKSMFLYSPPVLLAVFGWRSLRAQHRALARTIAIIVGLHFALIASLSFWGGDWAWGPRYMVVTLPLVCLGLPFVKTSRAVKLGVVGFGVCIQLLGISVDHQRFFFERGLPDQCWVDRGLYFRESALLARPAELISILANDPDGELDPYWFAPNPYRSPTYSPFGNNMAHRAESPEWMQHYAVFYVPRPWPLWMAKLPPVALPVARRAAISILFLLLLAGIAALVFALRDDKRAAAQA